MRILEYFKEKVKNVNQRRRKYLKFKKILEKRIEENDFIEELDIELESYIRKNTPNLLSVGEMHSLIFTSYPRKELSGILARYILDKEGEEYLCTNVFIENMDKIYLQRHRLLYDELNLSRLYDSLRKIFFNQLVKITKRGEIEKQFLEILLNNPQKKEEETKKYFAL